jgi:tetratricopeptide (TPR) repeat protein
LSASAEAPPGVAVASVGFTSGTDRGEAGIRIEVLPPPPDVVAYERGQAELARGLYDRAEAAFTEVIRLAPDSFQGHLYRGVASYFKGRHREALADYTAAIRLRPGDADAYLVRARTEIELGDTDRALSDYKEAIRLRPDANAHLARGWLLHQLGAYDQALADYNQALQLRPGDPVARFRRGLTRYYSGDNAGAIEDFTGVIGLDPRYADAYRYRGDAFARLGNCDRAGADHDTFERLNRPSGKNVFGSSRRILK